MSLVIVAAHSKWPEMVMMQRTTTEKIIDVLRELFSRHGVTSNLASGNGPQFTAENFEHFLKTNGILHILSARYHPSTNRLAKRFGQSLKMG